MHLLEKRQSDRRQGDRVIPQKKHVSPSSVGPKFFNRVRVLRLTIAIATLAVAVWTFFPGLFLPIGTRAVVNARVITIRAPISGEVTELNAHEGKMVLSGSSVGTIADNRIDTSRLAQFRAKLAVLTEHSQIIEREITTLAGLDQRMQEDLAQHRASVIAQYDRRLAEAAAISAARRITSAELKAQLKRQQSLHRGGVVSREQLERIRAEAQISQARLVEIGETEKRLSQERQAANDGVFFGGGSNNVPYSKQRSDEITIRLAELRARREETLVRHIELRDQISIEIARNDLLSRADLQIPRDGPVWRRLASVGDFVKSGSPLVEVIDNSEFFLIAHLDLRHFDSIAPGDRATIELIGSSGELEGRIVQMRGRPAIDDESALAVLPPTLEPRQFRAVVRVTAGDLDSAHDNFYQVGRLARVRIHPNSRSKHQSFVDSALAALPSWIRDFFG